MDGTMTALETDITIAEDTDNSAWSVCGSCRLERRAYEQPEGLVLSQHRVWHAQLGQMKFCRGSGQVAAATA
jgi:hypothetical protein